MSIWRLPRGSNTPQLAAGYLTMDGIHHIIFTEQIIIRDGDNIKVRNFGEILQSSFYIPAVYLCLIVSVMSGQVEPVS